MQIIQITPEFHIAGQIMVDHLKTLKEQGFTTIINNRPDGESLIQPASAEFEKEAQALGLDYKFIPVGHSGLTLEDLQNEHAAIAESAGKVLAFCHSGNRSVRLWALSEAAHRDIDEILMLARQAGYDLSPMRPMLQQLSAA